MKRKIGITGATGLIGRRIARKLIARGDTISVFTRSIEKAKHFIPNAGEYVMWDYHTSDWAGIIEGKDGIIHLAGENVMAKRWSDKHKQNVFDSRVQSTKSLVKAIAQTLNKPSVFVSASAIGYYGYSDLPVDEKSLPGNDFMAGVVKAWEAASEELESLGVRRVNIRTGIVLDKEGGALNRMLIPYKLFAGGPVGSGKQWFPWIHIDDVVDIFLFALDNENIDGAVNAVSPGIVRMNDFSKVLGNVMSRPSIFRVPSFMLKIIFGEGAEVLLNGANAVSDKLLKLGYKFRYEELKTALKDLLKENS